MRDADIRKLLCPELERAYPGARIVHELCISGKKVRADIAVISEHKLTGYEIKSDHDTLARLPMQVKHYNKIFDECAVVCGAKYADKVDAIIPPWWGIMIITLEENAPRFVWIRWPQPNPRIMPRTLVKLIWRDETMALLKARGLSRGLSKARRSILWKTLVDNTTVDELRSICRQTLRDRREWRE